MKKIKFLLIIIILSFIYLFINVNSAFVITDSSPTLISAYKNHNLIRLHVIANSNSPEDQYIKRRVRDEVNKYMSQYSYYNKLENNLNTEQIKKVVNEFLNEQGCQYSSRIELGNYYFPQRTYGNFTLPAGEYKALKVILGEGKGANWWCVLLPPVCVETEALKDKENSQDEQNKNNSIRFKLKLAEIFNADSLKYMNFLSLKNINEKILNWR